MGRATKVGMLAIVVVAGLAGAAQASGEPQPWPNYTSGWSCSSGTGCLKITNTYGNQLAETLRLYAPSGMPLVVRTGNGTSAAGSNAINAQNNSPNATTSTIFSGNEGSGAAFNGRGNNGPGGDFSSNNGPGAKFASTNSDALIASVTASNKAALSAFCDGPGSSAAYLKVNQGCTGGRAATIEGDVTISGHLYVNG